MNAIDFSDLEGDLSADTRAPAPAAAKPVSTVACPKCGGRGQTPWGPCFRCEGTGVVSIASARASKARATAQTNLAAKRAAFAEAHPAVVAWLNREGERGFEFAVSLREKLATYGTLTENQIAAVERCIARSAERQQQRTAERTAAAPALDTAGTDALKAALQRATDAGLKFARIIVDELTFTLAKPESRNAGAVYVKANGEYAGKVADGRFFASRDASPELAARVQTVMLDPLAAAKEYGLRTGRCSCCGRELTDPKSIELGIGPICAEKYFG